MRINLTNLIFTFLLFIAVFARCTTKGIRHNKNEVELALEKYDRLIQKMDGDSIALMYTINGKMGDMATGRDAIRKFLSTFTNVKVLSAHTTSDSLYVDDDSAIQSGRYHQIAVVDNHDTIRARGLYTAHWLWTKEDGWKIREMMTTPDKN